MNFNKGLRIPKNELYFLEYTNHYIIVHDIKTSQDSVMLLTHFSEQEIAILSDPDEVYFRYVAEFDEVNTLFYECLDEKCLGVRISPKVLEGMIEENIYAKSTSGELSEYTIFLNIIDDEHGFVLRDTRTNSTINLLPTDLNDWLFFKKISNYFRFWKMNKKGIVFWYRDKRRKTQIKEEAFVTADEDVINSLKNKNWIPIHISKSQGMLEFLQQIVSDIKENELMVDDVVKFLDCYRITNKELPRKRNSAIKRLLS